MQPSSFETIDVSPRTRAYNVFHDESGFMHSGRYGVHGMLAVPDEFVDTIAEDLQRIRRKHGYYHEIHYKKLGGTRRNHAPDWRVAHEWLNTFFAYYLASVRYKGFGIDTKHELFDKTRYPTMTSAYRRFVITTAKSQVAWSLRGPGVLHISPFTDAGSGAARHVRKRDGDLFKGFARYVERECRRARELGKGFYPDLVLCHPLRAIDSSPSAVTEERANELGVTVARLKNLNDFIQLTDLLTGCLYASLALEVQNDGKRHLAEMVALELSQRYQVSWSRSLALRRRFSFSMFPGPGRIPYAVSLQSVAQYGIEQIQRNKTEFQRSFDMHPDRVLDEVSHLVREPDSLAVAHLART